MNTVRIQNEKEILWIYLSRPQQLNALNEEMIAELGEVLDAVDKAVSRGVSPQQLLDAIRQQLDSLSPCNQGATQDD